MARERQGKPSIATDPYSLSVELLTLLKVGAARLRLEKRPPAIEGHDDWLRDALKLAVELNEKLKPTILQ